MKIECEFWDAKRQKCTHAKGDGLCGLQAGSYCRPARTLKEMDERKQNKGLTL